MKEDEDVRKYSFHACRQRYM